ncbi:MAG TPA: LemA family protein [Gammaproteobacteria bacterium]|nr:LemA family protein [Gammaproteobacteria bacterium]
MEWLQELHFLHYILIGFGLVVLFYFMVVYNSLVALKNNVKKAWANIDVLLKQRHEELPKLVTTCKQYMGYERDVLEKITELRNTVNQMRTSGDILGLGSAESHLRDALGRLFALSENYPDLKADSTFLHLQARISSLENAIADRRELYNENATLNNIRIEQFPDIVVAFIFRFKHQPMLEFQVEELGPVDMNALFKD